MVRFETETLAMDLAREFKKHYKKYSYKTYKMHNVKSSKWWVHFLKAAEKYKDLENFNVCFFIQVQFETHGKILPYFLSGKIAEKTYKENFYKEASEEEKIISEIRGSYDFILLWCSKHRKEYKDFFEVDSLFNYIRRIESLSPYFLCFSRTFLKSYSLLSNKEEVYSKDTLSIKRALANQFLTSKKEIRNILKDDFI